MIQPDPVTYKSIANTYRVNLNTVAKIWDKFCDTAPVDCGRKEGDRCSKLSEGDLEFIEILKTGKGSIQLKWRRAVKSKLLLGKRYTRKQITHVAAERFAPENMSI